SGAGKDGDPYDESLYLFFDLAPSMGHTHYDAMNIIISGYGSKPPYNLLDESGISHDWNVNPRTPQYFSPRAHNVVVIDGRPTPSWEDDPPPVLRKWVSNSFIDFASGSYGKKYEGNDLSRDILFVKGEYWILRDTIQGQGTHAVEQVFNFSPVVNEIGNRRERKYDFEIDPVSKAFHTNYKGPNLLLVPAVPDKVEVNLLDGWKWHEDLSDPNPAREGFLDVRSPTLSYSTRADTSVPVTFETILYPLHKQEKRRIIVEELDKGAPAGRETGLKILINESNLRDRRKEKRGAKADYFLTGSDSKESIIGPGIRFVGWHGIVRTNSAGVFLMCVVDGKKLEYHGLGMESERSADSCIENTRPGVYEVETTDAVSLSLPLVNKDDQPWVKMKNVFLGGWIEADFKIVEAGREVSVFIPSPGKYVIKVTEQKSIK
ncbi:MAG: heparinase II/III family protein, partial [Deltaproteobacteria bacterium]|nr:heparinase II/III family protein [Deltaproteobacteria bacterium]